MSFTYSQETFSPITATGGTVYDITIDGAKYRVHEFTTVGIATFTVSSLGTGLHPFAPGNSANSIEYLVVAGGGAGGFRGAGGGGAGGVGSNATTTGQLWGSGGVGLSYDISGQSIVYSTGGNGNYHLPTNSPNHPTTLSNLGNGGHGGSTRPGGNPGRPGGSGIVIIRYPIM